MKIAIIGTGANGSCIAADLTNAGLDVTLIDQWPEHVKKMQADGLKITMPNEILETKVKAINLCNVCTLNEKFDYIFIIVKAYDTRWICSLIEPYLSENGLAIGLQNGMTAKDIESIVGEKRTLAAVVELSSEIFIPGEVKRNTPPIGTWFGIGSMSDFTKGRESEVIEILKFSGKVSITENILSAKWMKLIVNAMTMGPRSLVGLKAMEAMELDGMRDLALKCGEEALNIGQKMGYTVEPIFGLKREDIEGSNRLLETLLDKIVKDVGPHAKDAVLHDHLKGRYSEVDLINGLVAEEGLKLNAYCPANKLVSDLTNKIKNGELKPDPSNMKYLKDY